MNSKRGGATSFGASGWILAASTVLIFSLAGTLGYYLWNEFPEVNERSLPSNLGFFLLININIIVVMILVFLVTKNIVTLVLDRRRNILGSRLRARLVTAFVALSLFPTVMLFVVAKGILESVLQGWFSPQIAASVDGALNVARFHSNSAQSELERESNFLADQLTQIVSGLGSPGAQQEIEFLAPVISTFLEKKRAEYGLSSLALLNNNGDELLRSTNSAKLLLAPVNLRAVQRAVNGSTTVRPEHSASSEFLSSYAPVELEVGKALSSLPTPSENQRVAFVLVATRTLSPELSSMLSGVINAYEDYNELRTYRRPLASSYLLTLVVVTLLIVFAAIWVGFYLAKSLAVPIGLLAQGTDQVAHGNLNHQIPETGDDELSILVRSFNTMTSDLRETTEELVAGRRYIEAVFANIAVGVVTLDGNLAVRTMNIAASEMLGATETNIASASSEALPSELNKRVHEMAQELFPSQERTLETSVTVPISGQVKHLRVTLTKLSDDLGKNLGAVMLVDDLTELVSAQRMAAWREVARRIAHEIKNPLTPIQLCAQRIERRFANKVNKQLEPADLEMVTEGTNIIVGQVENLRNLVNEFSRFARMPKSTPRPGNLNELLSEVLAIYRQSHPEITFLLHVSLDLPQLPFDREQLGRVLINLLDNAVASVLAANQELGGSSPRESKIEVSSSFDPSLGLVTVSVADTGLGISESDRSRLFEPYFSTKRGGTGLGLAIASAIISDHNGFIRVRDNSPRGAVFVFELPISIAHSTLKRANELN